MSYKLQPIFFTDQELREVSWAIHNYTRKGQKRREINAQGRAAEKVDTCVRRRASDRREREKRKRPDAGFEAFCQEESAP